MFLITGSGMKVALLNVASMLPTLIGPSTMSVFFTNATVELGCVHSDPWKVWALFWNTIARVLDASETSVSIELLPLLPCQALLDVLQGEVAQRALLLPLKVIVPATSI